MRFVFRLASLVFLTIAVLAGAVDAIQSVSASEPVLTPLAVTWSAVSPNTIAYVATTLMQHLHPSLWDPGAMWVLAQPTFAVMLALALLFWMAGYKRRPFAGRFTA
ncbi:hypothetical protein [Sinorhizobium sp. BG8]|uniref:hypothetical protein n=1 Tax=Sinorhizobium sp. BG8 TaxID=2613773 RepID=UPI00193D7E4D|nr:hypothetical protein [Sinorhizobium sp. BG8]QRM56784.1 hypothetical protein F3Y30_03920 [Sinorhizobium sp. BG8]